MTLIRTLLALALLALLAPSGAAALTLEGATPLQQQWAAESRLPAPDIAVHVEDGECIERRVSACYDVASGTIFSDDYAYLIEDGAPVGELIRARAQFLHELGHAADLRRDRPDSAKRRYRLVFARIMRYPIDDPGVDQRGRWRGSMARDGKEQLAMGYSYCTLDPYLIEPWVREAWFGYGYAPTQAQHRRVCRLLARWL